MPPLEKKQKKDDTSQPETVVSTSNTDEATVAVGQDVPVTKEHVKTWLRNLRNSDTVDQAVDATKVLHDETDTDAKDENRCKATAKLIVKLKGIGTIHAAMKDWNAQSREFTVFAIGNLVDLTCLNEKTKITLVGFGGIKTFPQDAKKDMDNHAVRSCAVALLCNISDAEDNETKEEVAVDACTEFILETMKRWPDDTCIQDAVGDCFDNVSTVDNIKAKLQAKGICSVSGDAIDKFLDSNNDQDNEKKEDACNAAR